MTINRKDFSTQYGDSIYPESIDILNRLYDVGGLNRPFIAHLIKDIPGFINVCGDDQGDWFCVVKFLTKENQELGIFFPWCQNWDGDLRLNKSIALCAPNDARDQYLDILQKVTDCFWDQYFRRSCHNPRRRMPTEIFYRILEDGQKAVPWWYVDVRASMNPVAGGDPFLSHLDAKKWFEDQGLVVM